MSHQDSPNSQENNQHQLTVLHQLPGRIRYRYELLKTPNLVENKLKYHLEKIPGVTAIRINRKICSLIICFNKDIKSCIEDKLRSIPLQAIIEENATPIDEQHPSIAGIVQASSALAFSSLSKNNTLNTAITTAAAFPLLIEGSKEFFNEGLTSKVLESAAVAISIYRKDYIAANSTNAMLALGEYIEETTSHKSDDLLKELAKPSIKEAWIERQVDNKTIEERITPEDIRVGDLVVVGAGQTIAIDGHVMNGAASVNESSMTGEAEPIKKERGDRVIAGTIVEEGRIKIWAEQVGADTSTQRIKKYIESSLTEKSSVQLQATRLADRLVPVTLGLGTMAYLATRDFERVAAVLQADYSCALKLATPVAFKSTLSHSGKAGIMIKGAKSIEALSTADTFIFDKTGTLTKGELEVEEVYSFDDNWTDHEILNLTASLEEHYFHPVAAAVVKAAMERGFVHKHHEDVEFIVSHGVKTEVDGKTVIIGSRHFLEEDENVPFTGHKRKINSLLKQGKTLLYIAYDRKLLGTICLLDKVRENSKKAIQRLRDAGAKHIVMLTGDTRQKAEMVAKELNIDSIYAELKPTEKAHIVKQIKEQSEHVVFVGDGINDAPALISANVGISMHGGADIAKATADVSLLKDDIEAVAEAKELSVNTMKLINANFNATVGINSAILAAATFGLISPITTAVLHNGTTIVLLLNSLKGVNVNRNNG